MLSSLFAGHAIGRRMALVAALAALACVVATPAHAVTGIVLLPGTTVTPTPITALPAGSTLVETSFIDSVGNSTVISRLFQAVYRESGGTLDFLFQVQNAANSVPITTVNTSDYGSGLAPLFQFATNVASLNTAPAGFTGAVNSGILSTSASRTASGTTVSFDGFILAPGQSSQILVVSTNATDFNRLGSSTASGQIQNGVNPGSDVFLNTYEPNAPTTPIVPEPASLISGSLAMLAGLGCFGWRRLKSSQA